MCVRGVEHSHGVPEPHHREVGPHDDTAHVERDDVGQDVFQRVRVHADDGERGCPLMVLLVKILVKLSVVQQPKRMGR